MLATIEPIFKPSKRSTNANFPSTKWFFLHPMRGSLKVNAFKGGIDRQGQNEYAEFESGQHPGI